MLNFWAIKISRKHKLCSRKIETLVLNTPQNPTLIKLPPKFLKSKISNLKKSLDHPCHLKSGVAHPRKQGVLLAM